MSAELRPDPSLRFAGIASVVFGFGSLFMLCTAGIPVYFGVVAVSIVAQRRGETDGAASDSLPHGALLLLAVGLATIVLDVLIGWAGVRILRGHPNAARLANAAAIVAPAPAGGVVALVLGVPGYESGWLILAAVCFHSLFAIGLAASLRLAPTRKAALPA